VCGTKNFVSVRLYSAPQSHFTIVAILGICVFGEPVQVRLFATMGYDILWIGEGGFKPVDRESGGHAAGFDFTTTASLSPLWLSAEGIWEASGS
jgi:hypothetical protein